MELTYIENYLIEQGDFTDKMLVFLNTLSTQKFIHTLKFEICNLTSLNLLWEPLSKIRAFEVFIKLEQVENLHLDQEALLKQFNEFYLQYNPSIQVITFRHLGEVV
jgi:hypothetical protein